MAFTEFYCQNGGSNLNAGSTTNNTALYTSIHGNWVSATRVFTPTDGLNPVSAGVAVGMFASVYIDGASVGVYIGRISAVVNAANGAITADLVPIGAAPANQTGTATIKVGGAFQGPNAASGFPVTLASFGNNQDSSSHWVRLNLKNDQTYTLTASITPTNSGSPYVVQGYSSSEGDGGRATWDGTTNTGAILATLGPSGSVWADHVFKTAFASGSSDVVTVGSQAFAIYRCVFTGGRGSGLVSANSGAGTIVFESEAYGNNTSNTASKAGFSASGQITFCRCYSHDNTGSNTAGFLMSGSNQVLQNCISDTNGGVGISITGTAAGSSEVIANCDVYNNGSDGIKIGSTVVPPVWIENCNLVKNIGAGINNTSTKVPGYVFNCGYGSGTQANGSADTLNNFTQSGTVTYASGVTPWNAPTTGDFSIVLAAANFAGRGSFLETDGTNTGTVGYPDIGAAQATQLSGSGEVSYGAGS